VWIAIAMGGIFGWATWKSAEPQLCANEIRGHRLRAALARTAAHDLARDQCRKLAADVSANERS